MKLFKIKVTIFYSYFICKVFDLKCIFGCLTIYARHKSQKCEATNASSKCSIVLLCIAAVKLYL